MSEATALLGELRTLRRRPRADARRYAPPLLAFGVLMLVSVALYRPVDAPYWVNSELDLLAGNGSVPTENPGVLVAYWLALLVGGTAFTVWWYHVRAVRNGIELRTQPQLMAAGAALLGILVGTPVLWSILGPYYWPEAEPAVHIPLLVLSAAGALAVLGWSASPARQAGARTAGLVAGFVLAMVAAGAVTMYLRGYLALVVIAAVVVAIAWVERSWWLAVVAAAFVVASLPLGVLHELLLPAGVLVVGALAGLVARRRVA